MRSFDTPLGHRQPGMTPILLLAAMFAAWPVSGSANPAVSDSEKKEILAACKTKWQEDFPMIKYCRDKQIDALVSLKKSKAELPGGILSACLKKWEPNWQMVNYCTDKQVKAMRELGL
ncbi:MAG: hypothetical protein IID18_10265 [Nitrospinae bacterium]|nr:hypothetical protein [Nitrospinota bacterium]